MDTNKAHPVTAFLGKNAFFSPFMTSTHVNACSFPASYLKKEIKRKEKKKKPIIYNPILEKILGK